MRPDSIPQVLILEPDPARQTAVAAWLEGAGCECLPVSDPDEALAIAQEDEADVAIVSGRVPDWNAVHLAAALQSRDADLPVIVVREGGPVRSLRDRRGAVEEIEAPLTRGSVMGALERALEWLEATPAERQRYLELERDILVQAALVREACLSEPCSANGLTTAFTAFLDRRMPGAAAHASRVALLSVEIGRAIAMDASGLRVLQQAAALHDFGLALLPLALRRSGSALERLDKRLAERHPDVVHDLLTPIPALAQAAALMRAAHERFDGSGHPRGLSGLEIPMGARIIALACGIDRLQQGYATEAPLGPAAVGAQLVQAAGTAYDPDLVRVWLDVADRAPLRACH